jgi:hypothetical protein
VVQYFKQWNRWVIGLTYDLFQGEILEYVSFAPSSLYEMTLIMTIPEQGIEQCTQLLSHKPTYCEQAIWVHTIIPICYILEIRTEIIIYFGVPNWSCESFAYYDYGPSLCLQNITMPTYSHVHMFTYPRCFISNSRY